MTGKLHKLVAPVDRSRSKSGAANFSFLAFKIFVELLSPEGWTNKLRYAAFSEPQRRRSVAEPERKAAFMRAVASHF